MGLWYWGGHVCALEEGFEHGVYLVVDGRAQYFFGVGPQVVDLLVETADLWWWLSHRPTSLIVGIGLTLVYTTGELISTTFPPALVLG